ncbi:MAG TPA: hypothetical protein VHG28_21545 [Longimicrobiaceae bacterium]|nr:hypothetical protein [Longimicrobiaceae bacterium]
MRSEPLDYLDQSAVFADERGVGPRAGIFLLDGRFHVANHWSRAERLLLDRGAVLVASLVFDGVEAERMVSGGSRRPPGSRSPALHPLQPGEPAVPRPSRN